MAEAVNRLRRIIVEIPDDVECHDLFDEVADVAHKWVGKHHCDRMGWDVICWSMTIDADDPQSPS